MANLHLVTGHGGSAHVTAADSGSFNAALFGSGEYVLNRGSKFAPTVVSNNTIRIADGDLLIQGRHVRLDDGSYVDLTIENGTQDQNRNDLIVARYTKSTSDGSEECNLVVIKGTATSGTASDPEYTDGDIINNHDATCDMPLFRIPLEGLTVQTPVQLFTVNEVVLKYGGVDRPTKSDQVANKAYVDTVKEEANAYTDNAKAEAKSYADTVSSSALTSAKSYTDGKHITKTATITTTWSGSGPYTQAVTVSGILASDMPHITPVYSTTNATAIAQKEAWACVSKAVTADGKITFTCFEDKPTTAIPIQIEVIR